ncbi:MAG: Xaa-Pro peptidase family protein [Candidatus Altiarchaeota archaeon]
MTPVRELRHRLRRLREALSMKGVKALCVCKEEDLFYLSGAKTGRILVTPDEAVLWVKEPYASEYGRLYGSRGYPLDVREYKRDSLRKALMGMRLRRIHVDDVSLDYGEYLSNAVGKRVEYSEMMKDVRAVKSRYEVDCIRKACSIAKAGMRKARETVDSGVRELDAVAEIEAELRRRGSIKPPFGGGMLLASGRGSSNIHAEARLRKIGRGLVVVDLGAVYGGYYSDTTRTFAVDPTKEEREMMKFVRSVELDTIGMIRCGMKVHEVYDFIDGMFKEKGLRQYHLPGHGVGLEIHENPSLTPKSRVILEKNMTFTIEPGVYSPGRYGVRFEDTILVDKKARTLT